MNNMKIKGASIHLDKERFIVFDLNAFADLEDEFGSLDKVFKALKAGRISTIRKFLYYGLKHEDEELTERQVGKLITIDALPKVQDALGVAIDNAMPEIKEDAKNK
jgi:hypothetical protein